MADSHREGAMHASTTTRRRDAAIAARGTRYDARSIPSNCQRSMPKRIAARRSPIHGNGVFALVDIPKGIELIEYRGKRLTHAQADRLYANTSDSGHTFLFTLNDKYVIDATSEGSIARPGLPMSAWESGVRMPWSTKSQTNPPWPRLFF
jgi:SET domain-containing protein